MNKKTVLIWTCIISLLPLAAGAVMMNSLPEQLPAQWAADGTVSSYAPKWFVVFGMPIFFLLMNLFLYNKAEKSDLSSEYPPAMKLFLKWAMPMLSVVCVTMTYSGVKGISRLAACIAAFLSVAVAAFGSYLDKLDDEAGITKIYKVKDSKMIKKIYIKCGILLIVFGIAASFSALMGSTILSYGISAAGIAISIIYARAA